MPSIKYVAVLVALMVLVTACGRIIFVRKAKFEPFLAPDFNAAGVKMDIPLWSIPPKYKTKPVPVRPVLLFPTDGRAK